MWAVRESSRFMWAAALANFGIILMLIERAGLDSDDEVLPLLLAAVGLPVTLAAGILMAAEAEQYDLGSPVPIPRSAGYLLAAGLPITGCAVGAVIWLASWWVAVVFLVVYMLTLYLTLRWLSDGLPAGGPADDGAPVSRDDRG